MNGSPAGGRLNRPARAERSGRLLLESCAEPSPTRRGARGPLPLLLGALALGSLAFGWQLSKAQRLTVGPNSIVWDQEPCAQCRMHIGDPAFAAQLQLAEGGLLHFDDPGCLFAWLASHREPVRGLWFRHHQEERWLAAAEVGFVPAAPTPMGYGLAAVARAAPGARGFAEVLAAFRARQGGDP